MTNLEIALEAVEKEGVPVFPVYHALPDGSCSCGQGSLCKNAGKHPVWAADLLHGHLEASKDPSKVRDWWTRWPDANIGMPTGSVSGILVIDVDPRNNGNESFSELAKFIDTERTPLVKTGGGGRHYYYRLDGKKIVSGKLLPGIDVKAEGGYVIYPGSNHKSGQKYEWAKQGPTPLVPREIVDILGERKGKAPLTEADWTKKYREGERNNELTRLVGGMFRVGMPSAMAKTMAYQVNQENFDPPLEDEEVDTILVSIEGKERRRKEYLERQQEAKTEETKKATEFSWMSFSEGAMRYSAPTQWLVNGWVPRRSVLIASGPPETWKSWATMDLVVSVATGRPFLGHFAISEPGPVIYVNQDDSPGMIFSRWAHILGVQPPDFSRKPWRFHFPPDDLPIHMPDPLSVPSPVRFDNLAIMDRIEQKIAQTASRLVVMEPLGTMMDLSDYGAKGSQDMGILKHWAEKYDCSFVLLHHGKTGDYTGRSRDNLWGSVLLNAFQQGGWEHKALTDTCVEITRHTKGEARPKPINVTWDVGEWHYRVEIEEQNEAFIDRCALFIASGEVTCVEDLMRLSGNKSSGTCSHAIKVLGAERGKNGVFILPKGKRK